VKVIHLNNAEWGYVRDIHSWSGDATETPDGRHKLLPDGFSNRVMVGDPDTIHSGALPAGYGSVRPFDTEVPAEERKCQETWMTQRMRSLDYYVAQRNGCPDPEAVGLYYPERVFIHGTEEVDGEERELHRYELLEILKSWGLYAHPGAWDPVQLYHGANRGFPTFHAALKAQTDVGPRWHDVTSKLSQVKGLDCDSVIPSQIIVYLENEKKGAGA
jgi:hypothetical protein